MARRRRRDDLTVSLFPFLSVLACVIGALTLLLAALSIGQMGSGSLAAVRLVEHYEALRARIEAGRTELAEIEAKIAQRHALEQGAETLRLRLAGLGLSPDISLEELRELASSASEAATLARRRAELTGQIAETGRNLADDRAQLEVRRAARDAAPIRIAPSGLGRDLRPYFVECAAEYVELHTAQSDFTYRLPREEIALRDDFKRFLRQVKSIHNGIVVFLVRPDGVASFKEASDVADRLGVRSARLPLPGRGRLDLSPLRKEG